jgi:nicotinate-nucleotide adenylyltransferase
MLMDRNRIDTRLIVYVSSLVGKAGSTMRLGLFGGTFDPVHIGHLVLAEQCREQCRLDEVRFIPAAIPPHKEGADISSGKHRVNMLDFALAGCPDLTISTNELERGGTSYTVDTLQTLADENSGCDLVLLMGMDSLLDFPNWREPERILDLATLAVVDRRPEHDEASHQAAVEACHKLRTDARERIQFVQMPRIDISGSDIRRRCRESRSIRFFTPRPVAMYIREHGLYQQPQ